MSLSTSKVDDGRSTIRTIGICGSIPTPRTLISIQLWSDPASAENAFRHGLVTWKNDEDPPEAPVVLKEIVHPDNRLRAREPSEATPSLS